MIRKKRRILLLLSPYIILLLGMIVTAVLFTQMYRQTAYDHVSAFCEVILENSPEMEQQLLSDLKGYHSLTEQELKRNNFLKKYGYRADEFCKSLPNHAFLFPVILFLATACSGAFALLTLRRNNQKRIRDLTGYLEQVNIGAGGTVIPTEEDTFSQLQVS